MRPQLLHLKEFTGISLKCLMIIVRQKSTRALPQVPIARAYVSSNRRAATEVSDKDQRDC